MSAQPKATPPAASSPKKQRWPLLGLFAWCTTLLAIGQIALALLWRDDLGDASPITLAVHYFAFMAATFVFHAGVGLLVIAGFALLARRRRLLIVSAVLAAIAIVPSVSLPPMGTNVARPTVRILSSNIHYGNASPSALRKAIEENNPDIIVFQEWTERGAAARREAIIGTHPHVFELARDDAFGQAVFSRFPFAEPPRSYPPGSGWNVPQISVRVDVDGTPLRICNVHILPPIGARYFDEQRTMAKQLIEWGTDERREDRPDVFVGDFNAVAGSSMLAGFARAGFVEAHSAAGFWRGSTWPRDGVLRFVPGIRIDNAFVGERWRVNRAAVLSDIGSDHAPIVFEVSARR